MATVSVNYNHVYMSYVSMWAVYIMFCDNVNLLFIAYCIYVYFFIVPQGVYTFVYNDYDVCVFLQVNHDGTRFS